MTKHPDCEDRCQILEHKGYHSCSQTGRCEQLEAMKTAQTPPVYTDPNGQPYVMKSDYDALELALAQANQLAASWEERANLLDSELYRLQRAAIPHDSPLLEFSRAMRKTVADKDRQGWATHTARLPTEQWLKLCDAIDSLEKK